MTNSEAAGEDALGARMRGMVERAIQRGVKGFQYATSGPAKVGLTPKTTLYGRGTLQLYHYAPQSDELYRVPVLMVMATTNKAFVFDLLPGQSMVEFLLKRGFDVFVIDWNPPVPEERGLTLEDYTQDFIPTCIRKVQQETGQSDVSVIGYCMGGVLSLIYGATHADGPLKNLVCLTTPVDFSKMGLTTMWNDPRYFDVDQVADVRDAEARATVGRPAARQRADVERRIRSFVSCVRTLGRRNAAARR